MQRGAPGCAGALAGNEREPKTRKGLASSGFGSFFFALTAEARACAPRTTTRNSTVTERTLPAGLHPDTPEAVAQKILEAAASEPAEMGMPA